VTAELERSEVIAAWCRGDLGRAVLRADREAIDGSMSVRELIVGLLATNGPCDELYDACAVLGRLLAQTGASPTLASVTVNHLADALSASEKPWVSVARAALAEGFASSLVELMRRDATHAWEFPSCAVPLGEAALAIAAGHPSEDDEVLSAWAARIAKEAALRGVRRAVVCGGDRPYAAVLDALTLVGISVQRARWE
jgi:hypothetical protein